MINTSRNKSYKLYSLFAYILVWIFLYLLGTNELTNSILFISLMLISTSFIYRSFKCRNILFLCISVYMFNYVYVLRYILLFNTPIAIYDDFSNITYVFNSSLVLYIFLMVFTSVVNIPQKEELVPYKQLNNKLFYYVNIVLSCFAMIKGKSGDNIFVSGGYGGEIERSSLNEYFFLFFVAAFLFSGNSKYKRYILYVISFLYCMKNLIYGGRIEVVMMFFCLLFLIFQFRYKFSTFVFLLLGSIQLFIILGNIRENPLILFSSDFYTLFLPDLGNSSHQLLYISSQEGDVNYAAFRLIGMADDGIIPLFSRFYSFLLFIVSIFVPFSYLPEIANLSSYNSSYYPVGGGGLLTAFFYVYSGYVGVIFIGLFLGKFLSNLSKSSVLSIKSIYLLFVFLSTPRWFAYNPISLFKFSLYGALFIMLLVFLDSKLINKIVAEK